jgi:hypothetical protein
MGAISPQEAAKFSEERLKRFEHDRSITPSYARPAPIENQHPIPVSGASTGLEQGANILSDLPDVTTELTSGYTGDSKVSDYRKNF